MISDSGFEFSLVFIDSQEEPYNLGESQTLGRHLDNDLIVSGEDVYDFHARLDLTARGPVLVAVNQVPLRVNGKHIYSEFGLAPGDIIEIGHTELMLSLNFTTDAPVAAWQLVAKTNGMKKWIKPQITIGRTEESDLVISDGHVSRRHAVVFVANSVPWVRDLNSSNGTLVNGKMVAGSVCLFHGDELCFDKSSFQLIGHGGDLTPVRSQEAEVHQPISRNSVSLETLEMRKIDTLETQVVDEIVQPGCYLIGMTEPVANRSFVLVAGKTSIGRHSHNDIVIDDVSVSSHHAELQLNSDGCSLMAKVTTNGTRINGKEISTEALENLDVIHIGGVKLGYRVVDAPIKKAGLKGVPLWMIGAGVLAITGLIFLLR